MALTMLGWIPIMAHIDLRKLSMLHKLCTMSPSLLCRQMFSFRLNLYILKGRKNQGGFVPDVCQILLKYNLMQYLENYLHSAVFPTKLQWKRITKQAVYFHCETLVNHHMQTDETFQRFSMFQDGISLAYIWSYPLPGVTLGNRFLIAQLMTYVQYQPKLCILCGTVDDDLNRHLVTSCPFFSTKRQRFLENVGLDPSRFTDEELFITLLGSHTLLPHGFVESDGFQSFLNNCFNFVSAVISTHRRLITQIQT